MASNFLTDGRQALLAALQADATLDALVRNWWTWGGGLTRRYDVTPETCPLCTVLPAELDEDQVANVVRRFPQDIEIGFATADPGGNAEPCERMVAAALAVIHAQRANCLGLYDDGLCQMELLRIRWAPQQRQDSPRVIWEALMTVRLLWYVI